MKKQNKDNKSASLLTPSLLIILFIGLILRLILTPFGTLWIDLNTFIAWSERLNTFPFSEFYLSWSDYLPGYLYILWILGLLKNIFVNTPVTLLYKLPAIIADLLTGWL